MLSVEALADGKVVFNGAFTFVNEEPQGALARLSADTAALQLFLIQADGRRVDWLRSGGGPEANRTTIELSSDNVNWLAPSPGIRTPNGWQFRGDDLANDAESLTYLRFRGYYSLARPDEGDFCLPIKTKSGAVAVICL